MNLLSMLYLERSAPVRHPWVHLLQKGIQQTLFSPMRYLPRRWWTPYWKNILIPFIGSPWSSTSQSYVKPFGHFRWACGASYEAFSAYAIGNARSCSMVQILKIRNADSIPKSRLERLEPQAHSKRGVRVGWAYGSKFITSDTDIPPPWDVLCLSWPAKFVVFPARC